MGLNLEGFRTWWVEPVADPASVPSAGEVLGLVPVAVETEPGNVPGGS